MKKVFFITVKVETEVTDTRSTEDIMNDFVSETNYNFGNTDNLTVTNTEIVNVTTKHPLN